jgi:acyl dehydratase
MTSWEAPPWASEKPGFPATRDAGSSESLTGKVLPGFTMTFTREALVRYAGASGDFNPIHWSNRAAQELGLPGVIAHGMLTMGVALRVVTDWIGDPSRILSYSTRFSKPVVVRKKGAKLRFSGEIDSVVNGIATVYLSVETEDERVLAQTKVEVRLD